MKVLSTFFLFFLKERKKEEYRRHLPFGGKGK